MFSYISLGLSSLSLFYILSKISSWKRNIALAKATGLPYHVSLASGTPGVLYGVMEPLIVFVLRRLPIIKDSKWPILYTLSRGGNWHEEMTKRCGQNYMIASPWSTYLNISDPEGIMQITTRKNDFPKPLEFYKIVDIFGSSIVSTEGEEWRRQRKVAQTAFAEKSNQLVWNESLRQVDEMVSSWSQTRGNTNHSMHVTTAGVDMAHLTLHVISGAGFGVPQNWHGGENIDEAIPGFNTEELTKDHTYTFKDALQELLSSIIWMILIPTWLLKISPLNLHKRLMRAHHECENYFNELAAYKTDLLEKGNQVDSRTMDIMAPLVRASQRTPEESNGLYLTKQEVTANSWLLLFAGHETTANTLHFTFIFLAMTLPTQLDLQREIDSILDSRPRKEWTYEKDMTRLYNGLVGASFSEALRLRPSIPAIPKVCRGHGAQSLRIDGREHIIPEETFIHLEAAVTQRRPRFWPHAKSLRTGKYHDLDDFVPQRWLNHGSNSVPSSTLPVQNALIDGLETVSYESNTNGSGLFVPVKGSYFPFSEGARSCPGRRFAQVELTAVIASVFKDYTVELDVSAWASDAEVEKMTKEERRVVYGKATLSARKVIDESVIILTLKMMEDCPLRIVKRGNERFMDCYL